MTSLQGPRQPLQRIVLTGFMGSGKTTVGVLLASHLGWAFADLDTAVQLREQRSVPEIFAASGEPYFREAEAEVLQALLLQERIVIALGGGAPGTRHVRDLLAAATNTEVVHLDAPFAVLYERCRQQRLVPGATERPLLGDQEETEQRYRQRRPLYAAIAHHDANAALVSPEAVAEAIAALLFATTGSTTGSASESSS